MSFNNKDLQTKDAYEKAIAKQREDGKRRATSTAIEVGDSVVVLKTTRAKGDPKFGPAIFKVVAKHHGDLELIGDEGQTLKRNVTHVKKLRQRPKEELPNYPVVNEEQLKPEPDLQPPQQAGSGPLSR